MSVIRRPSSVVRRPSSVVRRPSSVVRLLSSVVRRRRLPSLVVFLHPEPEALIRYSLDARAGQQKCLAKTNSGKLDEGPDALNQVGQMICLA